MSLEEDGNPGSKVLAQETCSIDHTEDLHDLIHQVPKTKSKEDEKVRMSEEKYKHKIEGAQEELVNKQAWFGRLLKKTSKINHFEKSKNNFYLSHLAFACLENLTLPFKHPCMMDLKMGSIAYNPKKSHK